MGTGERTPRRRGHRRRRVALVLTVLVAGVWANNSSLLAGGTETPGVVAHRGVGQTTSAALGDQGCFATHIDPPRHGFVENTIPSMRRAFDLGADVVELDVHPTTDGEFVVFHDWTLDCATDGTGVTRERSSTYIRTLDPGYRYTADGGRTFPLRGRWRGQIPLLGQVLEQFGDRQLLINIKSDDPAEGTNLAAYLTSRGRASRNIAVYGGDRPIRTFHDSLPDLRAMSRGTIERDLIAYELVGWTGFVPPAMRGNQVHVPIRYAPALWGWPERFTQRMAKTDTRVVLVRGNGDWSSGFDRPEDLEGVPNGFGGFLWTNDVGTVRPLLTDRG